MQITSLLLYYFVSLSTFEDKYGMTWIWKESLGANIEGEYDNNCMEIKGDKIWDSSTLNSL